MPPPANSILSSSHASDLALTRSLITMLISTLEKEIIIPSLTREDKEPPLKMKALLWGDKENAVGTLVKLTSLLLKVIPLEQQLTGNPISNLDEESFSPEDQAILERYIARITNAKKTG